MKNLTRLVVTLFALTLGSLAFAGDDAKKETCKDKDCKECNCSKDGKTCACKKDEKAPEKK
ncbi:MAG: hypothetical protein KF715_07490 [Candidatus Didemnitutus sp.]|nr:hypothetical protein [Candidatus Didemnitutus sp.]